MEKHTNIGRIDVVLDGKRYLYVMELKIDKMAEEAIIGGTSMGESIFNSETMKRLPIGYEDFKEIIQNNLYYVDKTLMIRDLLEKGAKINLFTRPRRFGKTLNLSMLKYFFEDAYDIRGEHIDNSNLFEGLKINGWDGKYMEYQGQYPVISLTLKSAKQDDFNAAYESIREQIAGEFARHEVIADNDLLGRRKKRFLSLMDEEASEASYRSSLKFLCECLYLVYGKKVIVLIDEYDVPLESAYFGKYYEKMVGFIRSLFESVLKTNEYLEFAVITGCLRISKESIFTGLNNLDIISIMRKGYAEHFGFTVPEVEKLCGDYGLSEKYKEIREWYDGYIFGDENVYNPWSVILQMNLYLEDPDSMPLAHWANTSSNTIVRDLIERADSGVREEIESLLHGGTVEKPVHEDITYDEIKQSMDNLWNFMFFTGYFRKESLRMENDVRYVTMTIPNREVRYIFNEKIRNWFLTEVEEKDRSILFNAFISLKADIVQEEFNSILNKTISFYDYYEQFYHGFVTGILTGMDGYRVRSNRESGKGRSDLFVIPDSRESTAFIIELKVARKMDDIEKEADAALARIIDKGYDNELLDTGYRHIAHYGIAFFGKDCEVHAENIGKLREFGAKSQDFKTL